MQASFRYMQARNLKMAICRPFSERVHRFYSVLVGMHISKIGLHTITLNQNILPKNVQNKQNKKKGVV